MTSSLGQRMRRARLATGLTLEQVLERLDRPITKAGLSKYELGKSVPDADFLLRFGRVCEVPPSYFLAATPAKVEWLAYRQHASPGARLLERVRAFAEERVEAWIRLRDALRPSEEAAVPRATTVRTPEDVERAAGRLREAWGLGHDPIENLLATLEHRGWIVVGWEDGFDGLSGRAGATPVVVVGLHPPADRLRFTTAHEIGHLLLRPHGVGPREEERLMHRFAGALLAPAPAVRRELGPRRTRLDLGELGLLKREWGLSMQAWIRRAADLGVIPQTEFRRSMIEFRRRGWHREEPVADLRGERPLRLCHMALAAHAERLVDEGWVRRVCPEAMESPLAPTSSDGEDEVFRLLRVPLERRRGILAAQAEKAREIYRTDPELTEFTALDGEPFLEEGE